MWTNQWAFGMAFKKPLSERSKTDQTYAKNTTKRRVAGRHDGISTYRYINVDGHEFMNLHDIPVCVPCVT